jgi:hypothetical protein
MSPHAGRTSSIPLWTLQSGSLPDGWKVEKIEATPNEKASLCFSEMQGLRLTSPSGREASILHFYWNTGNSMPSFAYFHTPQICMPMIGWEPETLPVPASLRICSSAVPCMKYQFKKDDFHEVAFRCLAAGGEPALLPADQKNSMNRTNRFTRLWQASPIALNEELLIYLPYNTPEEKQTGSAEEMLNQIVHLNQP